MRSIRDVELRHVLAQLRHAYKQLSEESVRDQKQFARGLIAPQIERIEKYVDEQ